MDIGAYEFGANPCPADVDGDDMVGVTDFLAVLNAWGPCESPCPEDIDQSGAVGVEDFLSTLQNWGACP